MPTVDYHQGIPGISRFSKRKSVPSSYGSQEFRPATPPRRYSQVPLTPPRTPTFPRPETSSSYRDSGVQQQLKILAALEAFREGKLPTNGQLLKIIDALENAPFLQHNRHKLSTDGKKALSDAEKMSDTLKQVLLEKNQNENLQHFIYHARMASMAQPANGGISTPALTDYRKGFSSTYNLGRLLLTNAEFRDLLTELANILQDIFVGTTLRATGRAPAEGGVASGSRGEKKPSQWGLEESRKRPRMTSRPRRTSTMSAAETTSGPLQPFVKPGPVPESMTVTGRESSALPVTVHGQSLQSDSDPLLQQQQQQEAFKTSVASAADGEGGTQQQSESALKGAAAKLKGVVRDESTASGKVLTGIAQSIQELPDEKLSAIMEKFKRVMHEIQGYPEYQDAISYLIQIVREVGQVSYYAAEPIRRVSRGSIIDPNLRQAQQDLFQLVENFANGVSLQPLFDHLSNFRSAMSDDRELRALIYDVGTFMEKSLREADFIADPDYPYFGSQLINRARRILLEKYREDTEGAIESIQRVMDGFASDELTQEFGNDVRILTQDLFLDENGRGTIKTNLVNDVFSVIIPMMIEQIQYLPIPRIEHVDTNHHVIIENIVLASENFLPNYMEVKLKNAALIPLKRHETSALSHGFTLNLYQIQAHMEDMPFYFRRKTFPSITDCGVCDVHLGGQGITVMIKMAIDQYSQTRTLVPRQVRCFVDQLDISIHSSQHDTLYRALAPALNSVIKSQVISAIENQVYDLIHSLNAAMTEWKVKYFLAQPESEEEAISRRPLSRFLSGVLGGGGSRRYSGISLKGQPRYPTTHRDTGAPWATTLFG